jgi:hypothetical protein
MGEREGAGKWAKVRGQGRENEVFTPKLPCRTKNISKGSKGEEGGRANKRKEKENEKTERKSISCASTRDKDTGGLYNSESVGGADIKRANKYSNNDDEEINASRDKNNITNPRAFGSNTEAIRSTNGEGERVNSKESGASKSEYGVI